MNRTIRAILAVIFIGVIMFSAISLCQNLRKPIKLDVTDQKIYTLCPGTRAILGKLNQPVTVKLYYARTAAMKAPDAIRRFNDYFFFVKALLEEYASQSNDKLKLEIVDPRPFSEEEQEALRYGLKKFPISEEENFFFGLAVKSELGASDSISFFAPDRQSFVEYDISSLLDKLITQKKKRIGVLSSLPVMGDEEISDYMAQMMRMQGQNPPQPWGIIQQLKQKYQVREIKPDTIGMAEYGTQIDQKDIDLLLVIHPKLLPENVLFAIDQYVLKGGRAVVCVDPHCVMDRADPQQRQAGPHPTASDLNQLLRTWGVQMTPKTFAGDRSLALMVPLRQAAKPEKIIGFLDLSSQENCFNKDNIISAYLNSVRVLFAGVLQEVEDSASPQQPQEGQTPAETTADPSTKTWKIEPLLQTSDAGNSWKPENESALISIPSGESLMKTFQDGDQPVMMGCLITGRLKSSFPEGIDVEVRDDHQPKKDSTETDAPKITHQTGLTEAAPDTDCALAVFSDVDFLTDNLAYQNSIFGTTVAGDNSSVLLNTIEYLSGSGDLISIRSRGNFQRPFVKVDQIERRAERQTAEQEADLQAQIEAFQTELNQIVQEHRSRGESLIDAGEFARAKKDVELKMRQTQVQLRNVQNQKRREIEALGDRLRNFCTVMAPAVILVIAILLGIHRAMQRRRYLSRRAASR